MLGAPLMAFLVKSVGDMLPKLDDVLYLYLLFLSCSFITVKYVMLQNVTDKW